MGNSYGCPHAVSWGTVNGTRPDGSAIQMNVSVAAGNSGGAVINSRGQVTGLVRAKVSEATRVPPMRLRSTGAHAMNWHLPGFKLELPTSGVSLAVPANLARRIAERIVSGRGEDYAYLGIYAADLLPWMVQFYHTDEGVVVAGIVENTPAEVYGLREGDLIRGINNTPVKTVRHFRDLIGSTNPGDRVLFDIVRDVGTTVKVSLVMGRAGTPQVMNRELPPSDQQLSGREHQAPGILRADDSMSIEKLNEIRNRILQSSDSLQATPVRMKTP
jgi:S1-C subfamily serine protease